MTITIKQIQEFGKVKVATTTANEKYKFYANAPYASSVTTGASGEITSELKERGLKDDGVSRWPSENWLKSFTPIAGNHTPEPVSQPHTGLEMRERSIMSQTSIKAAVEVSGGTQTSSEIAEAAKIFYRAMMEMIGEQL